MIVSIKQIGGHDGSGESRLAPAAQCGVEDVGAGAVRGAWGICSQGGDVAWREREHRARLAQARTRARGRGHVAARSHDFARQDGRQRAAFLAVGLFLGLNGMRLQATQLEATQVMLAVAAGEIKEAAFAAWLRAHLAPRS